MSNQALDELEFYAFYPTSFGILRYGSNGAALDELLVHGLIRVTVKHEMFGSVWYAPTIEGYALAERLGYKVCPPSLRYKERYPLRLTA